MKYLGDSQRHFSLGQARLFCELRKRGLDQASAHRFAYQYGFIFSAERLRDSAK